MIDDVAIKQTMEFTHPCVLRYCGNIEGCDDAILPLYDTDKDGNIIETGPGKQVVMDAIWRSIREENCAQWHDGVCVSRGECIAGRSYCYPIPVVNGRRVNKTVERLINLYFDDNYDEYTFRRSVYKSANSFDVFFLDLSHELERLINAYGDIGDDV